MTPTRIPKRLNKTDDWLTPLPLVRALGPFDLDPCASNRAGTPLATTEYRLPEHNGLLEPWTGRVWCNPPFSMMSAWATRFALHGNGIMICPLRLKVRWSQVLFDHYDALFLFREPVRFESPDGITKLGDIFDFMLVAMGTENRIRLHEFSLLRKYQGVLVVRPPTVLIEKIIENNP